MNRIRAARNLCLLMASAQVVACILLLAWALPLFFDPPVLGNGINRWAHAIENIAQASPEHASLTGAGEHLRWLFDRHFEGIFSVLAAVTALAASAIGTLSLTLILPRRL